MHYNNPFKSCKIRNIAYAHKNVVLVLVSFYFADLFFAVILSILLIISAFSDLLYDSGITTVLYTGAWHARAWGIAVTIEHSTGEYKQTQHKKWQLLVMA